MDQHCIALMSEFRKDGPSLIIWAVASRAGGQIEGKKKKLEARFSRHQVGRIES